MPLLAGPSQQQITHSAEPANPRPAYGGRRPRPRHPLRGSRGCHRSRGCRVSAL